jgi:hypothetical protein
MSQRLQLVCVIAVSFLASVALAQGQGASATARGTASLLPDAGQPLAAASAFPGQSSSTTYTFAPTPKAQDNSQQQGNSNQGQSQNGNQNQNQNQSSSANQNQNNQNQNNQAQAKDKEEAPPPKPSYLTYTVKKKSLEEQAKTGKTLAVDFKSVPAGATITVDGYFVGNTPTTAQIPVGKHLVSVTKWGYESWSQELDVAAGKDLSVNPKLKGNW